MSNYKIISIINNDEYTLDNCFLPFFKFKKSKEIKKQMIRMYVVANYSDVITSPEDLTSAALYKGSKLILTYTND